MNVLQSVKQFSFTDLFQGVPVNADRVYFFSLRMPCIIISRAVDAAFFIILVGYGKTGLIINSGLSGVRNLEIMHAPQHGTIIPFRKTQVAIAVLNKTVIARSITGTCIGKS